MKNIPHPQSKTNSIDRCKCILLSISYKHAAMLRQKTEAGTKTRSWLVVLTVFNSSKLKAKVGKQIELIQVHTAQHMQKSLILVQMPLNSLYMSY